MLENMSALAIIPKAKAIGAQRLTREEYHALMRKRSVLEVMATLQNHPYFKHSLAGLSQTNLHRQQLENALSHDVFYKYGRLMRYSFRKGHFGSYFMIRCEINELLSKLCLLSMGMTAQYIVQLPGFLAEHTSFSLIALAKADTAEACEKVISATPYAKILHGILPKSGAKLDYLACEHAFETYFYQFVLRMIDTDLSPRTAADTKKLFLYEAEIYNLDLLYRAKAFFSAQFSPAMLRKLLLPIYGVLSQKSLFALADTHDLNAFLQLYNSGRAGKFYGERNADFSDARDAQSARALYRQAEKLLHFSSSPQTALAALLCLANLERSNIINVIEGVRYGLTPEQIENFLKF
ncbi:MAG: V-type ATPase subunit [Ruthenibacterium sp.]